MGEDEAEGQCAVAKALNRLQGEWLRGQGWQPGRGTLMATWFLDGCKYAFASEFTEFCKDHSAPPGTVSLDNPAVAEVVQAALADDRATDRRRDEQAVDEALSQLRLDPISHAIVRGKIAAEPDKEIAVLVGLTPKAVCWPPAASTKPRPPTPSSSRCHRNLDLEAAIRTWSVRTSAPVGESIAPVSWIWSPWSWPRRVVRYEEVHTAARRTFGA